MIVHELGSAFYDEEWCLHCRCGAAFWAQYRPDAEQACRDHIAAEGIADARASLASALEKEGGK